ncbi:50S ribosomal protein L13 [Candidatus Peregrinibacteria bacterium CG11_big_fil_rev_8_21_14_0_20_46_8]|nr:MAG: 50S ribosomal protein L13 [Candidatus Peregrinibacteria bacterium CG11_big_fil_rev_8_21_14_0_20_46_8]
MQPKKSQKTTQPTPHMLDRKWFIVDVSNSHLGHAATEIAKVLRGKDKVHFTMQHDCGDHVVVINAKHVKLSGTKLDKKMYEWHTQFPGGFRSRTAREMLERKPEKLLYEAIYGMLPKNKLRHSFMKRLHIFAETEHKHDAQKPEVLNLK